MSLEGAKHASALITTSAIAVWDIDRQLGDSKGLVGLIRHGWCRVKKGDMRARERRGEVEDEED